MFHVYAFAAKTFNTILMSSTPPQGEEYINFDKQKDLDVLKHLSPKTDCNNLQIRGSLNLKSYRKINLFFTMA